MFKDVLATNAFEVVRQSSEFRNFMNALEPHIAGFELETQQIGLDVTSREKDLFLLTQLSMFQEYVNEATYTSGLDDEKTQKEREILASPSFARLRNSQEYKTLMDSQEAKALKDNTLSTMFPEPPQPSLDMQKALQQAKDPTYKPPVPRTDGTIPSATPKSKEPPQFG